MKKTNVDIWETNGNYLVLHVPKVNLDMLEALGDMQEIDSIDLNQTTDTIITMYLKDGSQEGCVRKVVNVAKRFTPATS